MQERGRIPHKKRLKRQLFDKNRVCPGCDREMTLRMHGGNMPSNYATLDHIIPWDKGGRDDGENFQLLCRRCNLKKDNLMPDEAAAAAEEEARREAAAKERADEALATKNAAEIEDMELSRFYVTLACKMCVAMGMAPNENVMGDDLAMGMEPTLNWQFMLPAAVIAVQALSAIIPADGDLLNIAAPDGSGFLMKIDANGELHMRENIVPGTPLFTLVNAKGDVTLAVGPVPSELIAQTEGNEDGPID